MFNASILELENQIQYHQEQKELAEQELDHLKMVSAFACEATDKVSEALEHIDEKYISVFKEHLLYLFSDPSTQYIKEKNELHEDTSKPEDKEKTYYELTGKPDLRPTTYEDLAPNIT